MSSISRRPSGRWRARYRDPHGVEHARHFPTRRDGQAWLDGVQVAVATGTWTPPSAGRLTLGTYYDRFAARQLWAASTRRSVDHALADCTLRDRPLNSLTRADVESWLRTLADRPLAPTTIRTRHAALRTVLAGAVRDGLIGTNPAADVRLPRVLARARAARLPTGDELAALRVIGPDRSRLIVALAVDAGLRLGEIRGLQVGDVDASARTMTVRRQIRDRPGGGWEPCSPKYGSVRTIPIPAELASRIRAALVADGRVFDPHAFVVPGVLGGPVHAGTVQRAWARMRAGAGLDPTLRLHDLRHLYASRLIAAGVDVLTVQHRLGHARASTTLDVYAHLLPMGPING